jgi:hypothetical protein
MARNATLTIPAGEWVQLTDADVTSITFQNIGGQFVLVRGTTDGTEPTDTLQALRYNPGQGERNVELADLFPGISAVRIWAFATAQGQVFVSHA